MHETNRSVDVRNVDRFCPYTEYGCDFGKQILPGQAELGFVLCDTRLCGSGAESDCSPQFLLLQPSEIPEKANTFAGGHVFLLPLSAI